MNITRLTLIKYSYVNQFKYSIGQVPGIEVLINVFSGSLLLSSWINKLLFGIAQGLLNAAANLLSNGLKQLIFFESPYADPNLNAAFRYNLDIFPQLLAIAVLFGFASRPFADRLETDTFMLIWKFVKVIIFVAVGRQVMHFGLLLVNAVGQYLYPTNYGMQFTGDSLQQALSSAGATGVGLAMTAIVLSSLSVLAGLLIISIFLLREFLFMATFVLLPILGCMLYLDFGPFKDAAEIAKMLLRSTTYLLLAGIVMAGLLQVGAAHGGAFVENGAQSGQQNMGDLIESYFFWLIGLMAPAFVGLKAAMAAGVSSRQILGAGGVSSKYSRQRKSRTKEERTGIIEQITHGGRRIDNGLNNINSRTATSLESKAHQFSTKVGNITPDWARKPKPVSRVGKTASRRAARDAHAGAKYAAGNLGESPVDWARAGIDHYRDEPLVDTSGESHDSDTEATDEETQPSTDEQVPEPTDGTDDWQQGYH